MGITTKVSFSGWCDDLAALTERVGSRLCQDFGHIRTTEKADGSLVTAADQWADQEIRAALQTRFPDFGLLSEETDQTFPGTEWCWVIDPLDGTSNFAHGIPIWGISIGLLHQGSPVFGYVAFPLLQQSFYGWHWQTATGLEQGAWVNGQPLQPSLAKAGKNQLFSFCSRSAMRLRPDSSFPGKIRMMGVATYNLLSIASGTMVGGIEATPKVWDIAAVHPILRAVGCGWQELGSQPFFPLRVGQDYSQLSAPILATSHPALLRTFLPWVSAMQEDEKQS